MSHPDIDGPAPPGERGPLLKRRRVHKMAHSAHSYMRGATAQFYEWLGTVEDGLIPRGPTIWICGDCHVGNLGPLADAKDEVAFQIRDLDQAVPGNPAHDLVRLGLSLCTEARSSDLPGLAVAAVLEALADGYCEGLVRLDDPPSHETAGDTVEAVLEEAIDRRWEHLAEDRLDHTHPHFPHDKHFWPMSAEERHAVTALVAEERMRALVCALRGRSLDDDIRLLDAAFWRRGCSSLGLLRFAALVQVGHGSSHKNRCLLDIKEAEPSVVPPAPGAAVPAHQAERVVEGARALSPHLGRRMGAATLLGRPVMIRELMPQDLKLEFDGIDRDEAGRAAHFLAAVVGHAHGRQMSREDRLAWAGEIRGARGEHLDAPPWLWTVIVDLLGRHERGYLAHCREYVLAARG